MTIIPLSSYISYRFIYIYFILFNFIYFIYLFYMSPHSYPPPFLLISLPSFISYPPVSISILSFSSSSPSFFFSFWTVSHLVSHLYLIISFLPSLPFLLIPQVHSEWWGCWWRGRWDSGGPISAIYPPVLRLHESTLQHKEPH